MGIILGNNWGSLAGCNREGLRTRKDLFKEGTFKPTPHQNEEGFEGRRSRKKDVRVQRSGARGPLVWFKELKEMILSG